MNAKRPIGIAVAGLGSAARMMLPSLQDHPRWKLSAITDIDRDTLDEIELAEKRIASGEYGRCVACKAAIPLARLLALPTTARCIDCQSEAEHRAHRP